MQIEDQHPSTLSISELLNNDKNKTKVVRILHQALASMGFKQSALELEKESNIFPEEDAEFQIKTLLSNRQYQKISEVLLKMEISPEKITEVQQILKELVLLKLIQEKQFEAAIERVMINWPEEDQKQLNFLSIIATDQPINQQYFESREAEVIRQCTSQSFELKNSIQKMLKGYLKSPQNEQTISSTDQPFKKVVAESQKLSRLGRTTFVKLSPKGNLICLINETRTEMEASLWMINQTKVTLGLYWKQQNFGTVCNVCWDHKSQKIAICSQTKFGIFDATNLKPKIIIDSRELSNARLLCCKWDYQGLLFIGGLSDAIGAIDSEGKVIRTIRPFAKTREMVFNTRNELYSICATKGLVTKFNIIEERTLASFQSPYSFMDIYLNESAETVIVTNKENIFLLNALTLTPITTLISPNNEKMYKIEAFFVNDWLFVYNEKLTAILQNKSVTKHHQWADCDAVDVSTNKMITVKNTIMVWQSDEVTNKQKNGFVMKQEEEEEGQWHSLNLQEQLAQHEDMESLSNNSSPSESSSVELVQGISDDGMSEEESNPINIEYLQNEEGSESNEQP